MRKERETQNECVSLFLHKNILCAKDAQRIKRCYLIKTDDYFMIVTGQGAYWRICLLTLPRSMPLTVPMPRLPMTIWS